MSKTERFLSLKEEEQVINAIKNSESNTSGEIRVHIEHSSKNNSLERAKEVFEQLKMHKTKLRNGILVYIAVTNKKFAILGDEGINKAVPANFWQETKNAMQSYFEKGDFVTGLVVGITQIGSQLKTFFPHQKEDKNELPNEISRT